MPWLVADAAREPAEGTTTPAPASAPDDNDALLAQIKALGDEISSYTTAADKYFGLAGSLSVAALAVASREGSESAVVTGLLVTAPAALIFVLHYVSQLWTERAGRVGVKRALEECLAVQAPGRAVAVEAVLKRTVSQRRPSVVISVLVYGLVVAFTLVLSVERARDVSVTVGGAVFAAGGVVFTAGGVLCIMLVSSVLELWRAEHRAYNLTLESLEGARNP